MALRPGRAGPWLRVGDFDATTPDSAWRVHAERLEIRLSLLPLMRGRVVVREMRLRRPRVWRTMGEERRDSPGEVPFARAAGVAFRGTAGASKAPGSEPGRRWRAQGTIQVRDGILPDLAGLRDLARFLQARDGMAGAWPFQELTLRFALRGDTVSVDTLGIRQHGVTWSLAGTTTVAGHLDLQGVLLADPQAVALPGQARFLAEALAAPDGRVPVDFTVGGTAENPRVKLAWDRMAARAAEAIRRRQVEQMTR